MQKKTRFEDYVDFISQEYYENQPAMLNEKERYKNGKNTTGKTINKKGKKMEPKKHATKTKAGSKKEKEYGFTPKRDKKMNESLGRQGETRGWEYGKGSTGVEKQNVKQKSERATDTMVSKFLRVSQQLGKDGRQDISAFLKSKQADNLHSLILSVFKAKGNKGVTQEEGEKLNDIVKQYWEEKDGEEK